MGNFSLGIQKKKIQNWISSSVPYRFVIETIHISFRFDLCFTETINISLRSVSYRFILFRFCFVSCFTDTRNKIYRPQNSIRCYCITGSRKLRHQSKDPADFVKNSIYCQIKQVRSHQINS